MRRVPKVVQLATWLLQSLTSSHGQHDLRHLQQGFGGHASAQKAHGQTPGHYSLQKLRSDIFIRNLAEETPDDVELRK
jgi:hypothetical protein